MDDAAVVADLAMELRGHYCAAVRRHYESLTGRKSNYGRNLLAKWDGGRDSRGSRHKAIWPKIAEHCLRYQLSPSRLVRVAFQRAMYEDPPWPTMLLSDNLKRRYDQYMLTEKEVMQTELRVQKEALDRLMFYYSDGGRRTKEQAARLALVDEDQNWSPVFAYVAAVVNGIDDIANEWLTPAVDDYLFDMEIYDEVYKGMIPQSLKRATEKARKRLYQ